MSKLIVFACLFLLALSSWAEPLLGLPKSEPLIAVQDRDKETEIKQAINDKPQGLLASWQNLNFWILQKQREFHRGLADSLDAVNDQGGWSNAWGLVVLSFLYGVFHAAGPGHGKAVLTTYLLTQPEKLKHGLILSFIAALLQGLTAILLVTILVQIFGRLAREAFASVIYVEMASFMLIAFLGLGLFIAALRRGYRHWLLQHQQKAAVFTPLTATSSTLALAPRIVATSICPDCSRVHHVSPLQVEGRSFLQGAALLLSIGLRPCSGAVLVLVVANLLGLWWIGVIAVMTMALGTSITVMSLALIAVKARDLGQRLLGLQGASHFNLVTLVVAALGGILLLFLGLSLFFNLATTTHPLGLA